jgi:hypothetical protein
MTKEGIICTGEDLQWRVLYIDMDNFYPISGETRVLDSTKYKIINSESLDIEEGDLVEFEVIIGKYTCGKELESAKIIKIIKYGN